MSDIIDNARDEFFSESQELIESFARTLLELDSGARGGQFKPDQVNEAFRAVHTLKSLAGLFSAEVMRELSHHMEETLDAVRLGKVQITPNLLNVLFAAVDMYWQALAAEKRHAEQPVLAELLVRLKNASGSRSSRSPLADYAFAADLLAVLTEFEEHRLRSCIADGLGLFKIRAEFELLTIDKDIETLKERAKLFGEVVTYLPTGAATNPDLIVLDVIFASALPLDEIRRGMGDGYPVEQIPRRLRDLSEPHHAIPSPIPAALAPQDPAYLLRSVSRSVRVDINKLDSLMNVVGELSLLKGALTRLVERVREDGNRQVALELQRLRRDLDRRLRELQSGILEVRMVPLSQIFERLARVVRQIGHESGKDIRLVITGGETELDKLIVEELSDPLLHIVRNCIDHGIESPQDRHSLGKPSAGTIALNAFQKGSHVVIEVEDDGAGIVLSGLVDRAVERQLIDSQEARALTERERMELVFLPGVSTRQSAGDISGRGVGMDVVKTNLSRLGGVIDLRSEPGIGTKVTMTLPITLAIVSALLVRIAGRTFALPLSGVSEALTMLEGTSRMVEGREFMTTRGVSLQLCRLDEFFGYADSAARAATRRFVVVVTLGNRRLGLLVDQLVGQQDVVIKSLGESLRSVKCFAGATEVGAEQVVLVLDAPGIMELVGEGDATIDVARAQGG